MYLHSKGVERPGGKSCLNAQEVGLEMMKVIKN
jgi:hypothetical protein